MKSFRIVAVLAAVFYVWGCKSSTETTVDHLSYDSDGNVVLQPPAPGEGIQIIVDTFSVPLGKEVQGDYYFQLPNDVPITVGHIEIAMNKGSHHMNCFRMNDSFAIGDTNIYPRNMFFVHDGKRDTQTVVYQQTFYTNNVWANSDLLVEAQVDHLDWDLATMPSDTSVPENIRGGKTVVQFQPHQRMIIENHYVNATTQSTPNGKGKIYINLYYAKESKIVPASMYVGRYKKLKIPANTSDYMAQMVASFPTNMQFPMYILGMTGHYHSHGKTFYVDILQQKFDSTFGQYQGVDSTPVHSKIYVNSTWNEPPFISYSSPIKVDVGQTLRFTAIYDNPTADPILFGPKVLTNEHDNLFVWFVPGWQNGRTVYDDGP